MLLRVLKFFRELTAVTYLSSDRPRTGLVVAGVYFSRGESFVGPRGVGLLRSLLVRPRGPREKQAPERGRMRTHATPSPRSRGACEGGVAGAVLKNKARDQKIQETNATIKGRPPYLSTKIQFQVQIRKGGKPSYRKRG